MSIGGRMPAHRFDIPSYFNDRCDHSRLRLRLRSSGLETELTEDQQTIAFTPAGMEYLRELLAEHKRNRPSPRP